MTDHLFSYSHPYNLGHKALADFWRGTIVVQEKIDGSQFTFGTRGGYLQCRSRKVAIDMEDPGMFDKAVATARDLFDQALLIEGWSYRCEYLRSPKHNTLAYERVPRGNLILFDIDKGLQDYLPPLDMDSAAQALDLECVPLLAVYGEDDKPTLEALKGYLETTSILGGPVEGIVLKNYELFGRDSKVTMAKLVSEDFREKHETDWKKRNPGQGDFLQMLIEEYKTDARWMKAVQHLRESGTIEGIPQDIPHVMREIVTDVETDCAEEIRAKLYAHFWPQIKRGLTKGAPEWYKALLAEEAME